MAVWEELGLFREEHPALLAGNVIVRRKRVTACLDTPYGGLPAASVLGLGSVPRQVMTIENLTTFHSEAKRICAEDITAHLRGMPSPALRAMYGRILREVPERTPIFHGATLTRVASDCRDTGAGSARSQPHTAPWRMHPDDVPANMRRKATPYVLRTYAAFCSCSRMVKNSVKL